MILLLHIIIAVTSVLYTGYILFSPSKVKLRISYGLVGVTFISGSYLIILQPSHMVTSCITGLVYLGFVFGGIALAHYRLARSMSFPQKN